MGLGLAFDLLDLDQALVAVAGGRPGSVDRAAQAVDVYRVHPAVGQVRVVRDGEQFVTRLALGVHPFPQVLRVPGIECGERHLGNLGALRVLERVGGSSDVIAEQPSIHGPAGVDVLFAEIGFALGAGKFRICGCKSRCRVTPGSAGYHDQVLTDLDRVRGKLVGRLQLVYRDAKALGDLV